MGGVVTQYQVTAACVVHIPAMTASGPALGTFYRDAILPEGVPQDRIDHLLAGGMIRALDVPAEPAPFEVQVGENVGATDGLTINSRSSKAELVAYGVAQEMNEAELDAMTVKDLQALFVKSSQP